MSDAACNANNDEIHPQIKIQNKSKHEENLKTLNCRLGGLGCGCICTSFYLHINNNRTFFGEPLQAKLVIDMNRRKQQPCQKQWSASMHVCSESEPWKKLTMLATTFTRLWNVHQSAIRINKNQETAHKCLYRLKGLGPNICACFLWTSHCICWSGLLSVSVTEPTYESQFINFHLCDSLQLYNLKSKERKMKFWRVNV